MKDIKRCLNKFQLSHDHSKIYIWTDDSLLFDLSISNVINAYSSQMPTAIIEAKEINIVGDIILNTPDDIILIAKENIIFKNGAKILSKGKGNIYLKAGMENEEGKGKVIFENSKQLYFENGGMAYIYYNPEFKIVHKYLNPYGYFKHIVPSKSAHSFMLVNDIHDLQDISYFLHGNYALSKNIDASETKNWNNGAGFIPLMNKEKFIPFSGNFDGNNYEISSMYINNPNQNSVGIFGIIVGSELLKVKISNLKLKDASITGDHYVGGVSGEAEYVEFINIQVLENIKISGRDVVGGIIGTGSGIEFKDINFSNNIIDNFETLIIATEYKGLYSGSLEQSITYDTNEFCNNPELKCHGYD